MKDINEIIDAFQDMEESGFNMFQSLMKQSFKDHIVVVQDGSVSDEEFQEVKRHMWRVYATAVSDTLHNMLISFKSVENHHHQQQGLN